MSAPDTPLPGSTDRFPMVKFISMVTLADKIVVLRKDRIEQVGAPLELYSNPNNSFVVGFIG